MSQSITGYVITDSERSAYTKFILYFFGDHVTPEDRKNTPFVHDTEEDATAQLKRMLTRQYDNPGEFHFAQACSVWHITLECDQLPHTAPDAG